MTSAWWDPLLVDGVRPSFTSGIWRLHQNDAAQFFAEYLDDKLLQTLLDESRTLGWRSAVEHLVTRLPSRIARYTSDYFLEPYRARFVDTLGIQPGTTVL